MPVREGETVVTGIQNSEGSTLMTLADMSIVTAEVKVDETDIVNIRLDQNGRSDRGCVPGKVFKGHVTLVGDQALLRSTASPPRSRPPVPKRPRTSGGDHAGQPNHRSAPGLSTTAKITTAHKSNALSLPIQALNMHNPDDDKPKGQGGVAGRVHSNPSAAKSAPVQGVYVVDKDKSGKLRARFVPVTTGITGATDIEVLSGLTEGQEIVNRPLQDAARLKNNALLKRGQAAPARRRQLVR